MTPEEIEACWKDPRNYTRGVYYCKADPRVVVPRRWKWAGWTLNFARPSAIPVLLGMLALIIVPSAIVRASGAPSATVSFIGIASILAVCLLSGYLSSTKRRGR